MVNYELATKLKDAGFPLKIASLADQKFGLKMFDYGKDSIGRDATWLYPTLSKLIEECGDGFFGLMREVYHPAREGQDHGSRMDKWIAFLDKGHVGCEGDSPEEAVANLYLEIKKHV